MRGLLRRLRSRLAFSLFWKIYLTLVACLVLVSLVTGALVHLGTDDDFQGWRERGARFFAAMLPPGSGGAELERLAAALGAELALRGGDGELLAGAAALHEGWRPQVMRFALPDGRTVLVQFDSPWRRRGAGPLLAVIVVGLTLAAGAYPVVRHLTRRLERLRRGVEAWGEGALDTRVGLAGRDEVAAVARSFDRAAETVERLIGAHRTLLANASHELRSPLARLRLAIDMGGSGGSPETRAEIVQSLAELEALVEEILLTSRLDHAASPERREPVDLLALAAEEAARVDAGVGAAVEGVAVTVPGEERLLRRLVRNLLQNAARHGAPPIEVRVEPVAGGGASLAVRDHGPGLPEGEAARVFEPFYRPRGHGEDAGGWGLGLALVRQIARRHGGEVRHATPEGGGAVFVVELPGGAAAKVKHG